MFTIVKIDEEIVQSENFNSEGDFVAAAVKITKEGEAEHAGIVIYYNKDCFLLHYNSVDVKISGIPNKWYFHKPLQVIPPIFVASFLSYCRKVVQKANPEYGYVYGGSIYDQHGQFFSEKKIPEVMTCVGFCINVVLGFIEADEYISYSDWTIATLADSDKYIAHYRNEFVKIFPDLDMEELIKNIRRVKPSEFLTSAFLNSNLPIRKIAIDEILDLVEAVLVLKKGEAV
ncbi:MULTISPECIES: hypothetical protein [unclassified Chitinophaga]|uniref:hypothetical protein n=1 Tax=unclassified Chitinophaga TaxID=2619133 RepID=UPI00301010DB